MVVSSKSSDNNAPDLTMGSLTRVSFHLLTPHILYRSPSVETMKRRHSSGSLRGRSEGNGYNDIPVTMKTSDQKSFHDDNYADADAEEGINVEKHRDNMDANSNFKGKHVIQQTPPLSTVFVPAVFSNDVVANCRRSRSVRRPDGSIRTRVRTRTHHHLQASNIFWHDSFSCERSHTVRLADGTTRTRKRTRTLRTTAQDNGNSFWTAKCWSSIFDKFSEKVVDCPVRGSPSARVRTNT